MGLEEDQNYIGASILILLFHLDLFRDLDDREAMSRPSSLHIPIVQLCAPVPKEACSILRKACSTSNRGYPSEVRTSS